MKVQGPYGARAPEPSRRKAGGGGAAAAFNRLLDGDEGETAVGASRALSGVRAIEGVFAAQEVGADEARRRAKARADRLLDRLEELRLALLLGGLPPDYLQDLVETIQLERPFVTDPQMAEVLDEIDLRAQVELAKLEV